MICECTIPQVPTGKEECHNVATWHVLLTAEFNSEKCKWCDECLSLGKDMIHVAIPITKGE